jgi:hypothetical protein
MHSYYFYLTCSDDCNIEGYQKLTLRTMAPAEASAIGVQLDEYSVPCYYIRSRGDEGRALIPIAYLSARLPRMRDLGMVVKDPGNVKALDPAQKRWSVELEGSDVLGRIFKFARRDFADRNDTKSGRTIASLQVLEDFGEVPKGKFIRVPVECFCGIEAVAQ